MSALQRESNNLIDFFKNIGHRSLDPEVLYAAVMAISFITAVVLFSGSVFLVVKLVSHGRKHQIDDDNKVDVTLLKIPTNEDTVAQAQYTPFFPVDKIQSVKGPMNTEEIISEHIYNMTQSNNKGLLMV